MATKFCVCDTINALSKVTNGLIQSVTNDEFKTELIEMYDLDIQVYMRELMSERNQISSDSFQMYLQKKYPELAFIYITRKLNIQYLRNICKYQVTKEIINCDTGQLIHNYYIVLTIDNVDTGSGHYELIECNDEIETLENLKKY